jgi:hypothetical protein
MSNTQKITPAAIGHGVRRLCIAVDLERYSRRADSDQVEAQRAMSALLHSAGQHGALERAQWLIQPQGDGELALLPPGIDEAYVISSLVHHVRAGLHRYNQRVRDNGRLRMRIAVHEGVTFVADSGFAGDAINTVCRLRDARESKEALSATESDLVLIASARIFHDVIRGSDGYDMPSAEFRETEIVMADKGFRAQAFIYAGRAAAGPEDQGTPRATAPPSERAPAGGATFNFHGRTDVGDIAGRDMYKGSELPARDVGTPVYRVRDE